MTEKMDELEQQRKKNAAEMDERVNRIRERMMSGNFPMEPDNPLLNSSDEETRAYIRRRRDEFMAPGGKWDEYLAEKTRQESLLTKKNER